MSPRAAWRLESLGFREVYEYRGGKVDWLAAGLLTEGPGAQRKRIRDYLRTDVPTCRLDEKVADAAARVTSREWDMCLVVNDQGIVLGRLDRKELQAGGEQRVDQAMRPGPATYRPDVLAAEMPHVMTGSAHCQSPPEMVGCSAYSVPRRSRTSRKRSRRKTRARLVPETVVRERTSKEAASAPARCLRER
jgi:hypothetical protein